MSAARTAVAESDPGATRRTAHVPELHHLPVHEAVLLLESDPERGLDDAEAAARRERFGPNVLPPCAGRVRSSASPSSSTIP